MQVSRQGEGRSGDDCFVRGYAGGSESVVIRESGSAPQADPLVLQICYNKRKMSTLSKTTFQDWQEHQEQDPDFVAESLELEIGYQIARLRILQGLTQEELAERVGTRQPSIARLESGRSLPSLSFLEKIAAALDATIEIRSFPKLFLCKTKRPAKKQVFFCLTAK